MLAARSGSSLNEKFHIQSHFPISVFIGSLRSQIIIYRLVEKKPISNNYKDDAANIYLYCTST